MRGAYQGGVSGHWDFHPLVGTQSRSLKDNPRPQVDRTAIHGFSAREGLVQETLLGCYLLEMVFFQRNYLEFFGTRTRMLSNPFSTILRAPFCPPWLGIIPKQVEVGSCDPYVAHDPLDLRIDHGFRYFGNGVIWQDEGGVYTFRRWIEVASFWIWYAIVTSCSYYLLQVFFFFFIGSFFEGLRSVSIVWRINDTIYLIIFLTNINVLQ